MNHSFPVLLDAYRRLWPNRSITAETLDEQNSKALLYETIRQELRDEWTHPRVRQTPEVKFHYAVKRIATSGLPDRLKLELLDIYLAVMEQLRTNHT